MESPGVAASARLNSDGISDDSRRPSEGRPDDRREGYEHYVVGRAGREGHGGLRSGTGSPAGACRFCPVRAPARRLRVKGRSSRSDAAGALDAEGPGATLGDPHASAASRESVPEAPIPTPRSG